MDKNINKFKTIAVGLALFSLVLQPLVSLAAGAQFNTDPSDKPVLRVSNYTQNPGATNWSSSISGVRIGDVVSFVFYYHNTGDQTASNARAAISFSYGSGVTASGIVSADNASAVYGSASVYPVSGATITSLTYNSSEWYPNQSTSPTGAQGGPTTFNLGSLTPGWGSQGYLVVRYTVNGPSVQNISCTGPSSVVAGNTATFTASGGNAPYSWSEGGGNTFVGNPWNFSVPSFYSGAKVAHVTDANGNSANCNFNVTPPPPSGSAPSVITNSATNVTQTSANVSGSVTPNGSATTCWFDYGTTQSFGQTTNINSSVGSGGSNIPLNAYFSGLSQNTAYYFRATCQNSFGTAYGQTLSFTTQNSVQYSPSLTVNPSSATVNSGQGTQFHAMYDPDGASGPQSAYEVTYSSGWNSSNTSVASVSGGWATGVAQGNATITATYSGLSANTYLTVSSVTPPPPSGSAPSVITNSATNVTQTSANVSGSVTPNGSATTCWFDYGTTQSFGQTTNINSSVGSGGSNIPLNAYFSGLSQNTAYYFRATCQNSFGTAYGQTLSFTTTNGGGGGGNPPTVSTFAATNANQNSATVNGQINPNGFATTYWFEYGTTQSLGQSVSSQSIGSGTQSMNVSGYLSGLNPNTTYYFRASAQNQYGTSQGQIFSFNTNSAGQPTLTLSQNSLTVNAGVGIQIQALYDADGPTGPIGAIPVTNSASWNSSNTSVSTVSGGFINGIQAGSATVTATYNGLSASATVTVYGGTQGSAPVVQTTGATNTGQNSATLNGTVNPNNSATTYWFEYGTSYSLGSTAGNQSIGSGGGSQNVSYYLSGLIYSTTYYYRVVAQNQYGTIQGQILTFTTNSGGGGGGGGQYPIATTNYIGNQSPNSATLNGTVNPNGSQTNYWFEYGQTSALGQTTGFQYLGSFASPQSVSAQLYNLIPNMNYFYRVAAQNSYGMAYGSIYSFTTQNGGGGGSGGNCNSGYNYNYNYNYNSGYNYNYNNNYNYQTQPCAQTNAPTNLNDTSATFNAYVVPNGSDTTAWFEYGINNYNFNYTTNNTFIQAYNNSYNFSSGVAGLTPNSTYYVRVAARNQYGITYGQPYQFSTTGSNNYNQPSVITKPATYVSLNAALLNGSVNSNGAVGNGWFEYGPTVSMGLKTNSQAVGSDSGFVDTSWALTGLLPSTTYYYRAVGQTSVGTAYGSVLSFRTLSYVIPPVNPPLPPQPPVIINTGSCLSLNPTLDKPQVNSGDAVTYTLVYKNNCGYDLQSTQLKIVLPLEASFTASNAAFAGRDQNSITYNLGVVTDGYQGTIEVKNSIGSDVQTGATLLYGATASWNNKAGRFFTASAYISALVAGSVAGLASVLSIFGGWGWLWLLLLLLIAFAVYWIFFREEEKPTAKQKIEASIAS